MIIRETLETLIKDALHAMNIEDVAPVLLHPDIAEHGDYASNAALIAAPLVGEKPRDIAETIVEYIEAHKPEEVERAEVAGTGFVNVYLSSVFFATCVQHILETGATYGKGEGLSGKKIMVDYTDPNVFKAFHVGHLMSNAIGESLTRLFEAQGARVVRVNYQGDVGMHVAKAVWGMRHKGEQRPSDDSSLSEKITYISSSYVHGAQAFEEEEETREEIEDINTHIYEHDDAEINALYQWGRQISLDHFEEIYALLGTRFDHYFFESDVAYDGVQVVEKGMARGVFIESRGAVIFKGEDCGLHNRVFITSKGLPTYEAKDMGLALRKHTLEKNLDQSLIITANEQNDYFNVVFKALEHMAPDVASYTKHISHGMMKGAEGKFSSRKGNAPSGEALLGEATTHVSEIIKDRELTEEEKNKITREVAVAGIKYAILRQSIGKDIIFDMEQSLSFDGDSGPYLQYAHTRACALLEKARAQGVTASVEYSEGWVTTELERMVYRFPEVVERAAVHYAPHHLTAYLTNLASLFNSYYATERIVDPNDTHSPYKVALTSAVRHVLNNGLYVLGMNAPEKM